MPQRTAHGAVRMGGRDPVEEGRAATPLELLFDLSFVIAFGAAANELAHFLVEDHVREGVVGFAFATFAVTWAWINFSWFASAYDTDDWIYRLTTMVQMVGVLILALGVPDMFESLVEGDHVDNRVMVLGYVVMRVPMVAQWARASRQDPDRATASRVFIATILVSQVGWIVLALAEPSVALTFDCVSALVLLEMVGPIVAERLPGGGTPWHAHHIAERYGLLVIIALGEGLIGGAATLAAMIAAEGWTVDVALLGLAGVGLTFGMWWTYFVIPCGDILHAHRERGFGWGYGHIPFSAPSSPSAPDCTRRRTASRTTRCSPTTRPCSPWWSRSACTSRCSTCSTRSSPTPSTRSTCCWCSAPPWSLRPGW
jgi:low temperature requirement protein LtrA